MSSKSPYTFIDTSVFMEVFKCDQLKGEQLLAKATLNNRRSAAYWSIIEINKYFLVIAIDLHNKVMELKSAPDAVAAASNGFGRATNYILVLQQLMMRGSSAAYHTDYRLYASQLEVVIVDLQDRVRHMVSKFEGLFASHPITKSFLYSSEDFETHLAVVSANKSFDFTPVWKKYKKDLLIAQTYFNDLPSKKKGRKLNQMEREIKVLIDSILTPVLPPTSSKRHNGDLIISLTCPKGERLVAHDRSFDTIVPSLAKVNSYVDFDTL